MANARLITSSNGITLAASYRARDTTISLKPISSRAGRHHSSDIVRKVGFSRLQKALLPLRIRPGTSATTIPNRLETFTSSPMRLRTAQRMLPSKAAGSQYLSGAFYHRLCPVIGICAGLTGSRPSALSLTLPFARDNPSSHHGA